MQLIMGMYDTYGKLSLQLKVSDDVSLHQYNLGDKVDIPDGVYIGYEGAIAIQKGKFAAESTHIFDKWGGEIQISDLLV